MNTHIVIPIKEIEWLIESYREDIKTSERGGDTTRAAAYSHKLEVLENLLGYKQISLDEKDIEEKVQSKNYCMDSAPIEYTSGEAGCWAVGADEGYRQALKDLL